MNTTKEIIENDLFMMSEDIKVLLKYYSDNKSEEEAKEMFTRLTRRVQDIRARL